MSDYERGAYAPQGSGHGAEPPLRFDSYGGRSRGRQPLPMTLIGSAIVLLLLVTALVMFYRSGAKGAASAPRPVGGAITAIKTAPTGAQPAEPGAGLEVYSPQNVPSATAQAAPPSPQFAPAPEQPMARPTPPPLPVAAAKTAPTPAHAKPASQVAATSASPSPTAVKSEAVVSAPVHKTPPASVAVTSAAVASGAPGSGQPLVAASTKVKAATPVKTAALAAKTKVPAAAAPDDSDDEDGAPAARTTATDAGLITTPLKPTAPSKLPSKAATPTALNGAAEKTTAEKAAAATAKLAAAAAKRKPVALKASASAEGAPPSLPKGPLGPAKPAALGATPKGGFAVQVGAFPSAADADKGFSTAASKVASAGGKARHVETVQKDGKTYYRSTLKGFSSKADAAAFCAALRAKGGQCIVRGTAG